MVGAVANAPAMVGHQNGRVRQVSNQVIQPLVLRERTVTTVMTNYKQSPKHGALCKPEKREEKPRIDAVGQCVETSNDA